MAKVIAANEGLNGRSLELMVDVTSFNSLDLNASNLGLQRVNVGQYGFNLINISMKYGGVEMPYLTVNKR